MPTPTPTPIEEFTEEQLLAFDKAYANAKDDGSLQRQRDHRALEDQIKHQGPSGSEFGL